ncbi:MAG: hypothetical protein GEU82_04985 [Luteitalea sp.]|nr:hypothetical protein [Luteitalea sp.]
MSIILLGISALVSAALALGRQSPAPPPDFVFQFSVGSCTLDTSAGTLVHDQEPRLVTALVLSQGQMREIAAMVGAIAFFDYPATFVGAKPGQSAYSIDVAATRYRLHVRLAGKDHAVSWIDSTRPSTEEADRLRSLCETIAAFITAGRGFEQLRLAGADCR